MLMHSVNPATGQVVQEYASIALYDALARLDDAHVAWQDWRHAPYDTRAAVLRRLAALMRKQKEALARLATLEMGKPIAQAEAEVEKCALTCEWYAENGERLLADEPIATDATRSFVRCEPIGVLLAVMPWNFPYWQAIRAAAPAILAGNAVALKHASNVPGVALAIERLWHEAGLPPALFCSLLLPADAVGALIEHDAVAAVTVTGSEAAGRAVAAAAGAALKKVVLELGGSDAFVVLANADVEHVAAQAVTARVQNNGQSCIAAKRFIVSESIAETFEAAFTKRMRALQVGDPAVRETEVGPLARPDLVRDLHAQVQASIAMGAKLACGGEPLARGACFYAPTVLTHVAPGMPVFDEETFGPVAAVIRARDQAHAITLANQSRFGLGASVWSRDAGAAEAVAARLEAGAVFVNGLVTSDARLPFGGIKASGHGRELAQDGIREFVNRKTVWIR